MHIQSIPMWTGKGDNYAYLVTDPASKSAVIIDPANPPEVLPALKEVESNGYKLTAIINTHHHPDHAGGNIQMLKHYPSLPVIGGRDCACVTVKPDHKAEFRVGNSICVTALHTPCHTQDSICYYFEDAGERVVFSGDTLFVGGCGRFFEGNAAEMHKALNHTLAALPDDTKVYPGHEYTQSNAKFALSLLDNDTSIQKLNAFAAKHKQTQGIFTIGDEKKHNVFMRVDDPAVQEAINESEAVKTMERLRELKNQA